VRSLPEADKDALIVRLLRGGDAGIEQTPKPMNARGMDNNAIEQQAVVPMIAYADGSAAMDWLATAFGFVERRRWLNDDGSLSHGEMIAGGGLVMMATPTPPSFPNPRTGFRGGGTASRT